ncbi:MAG TPA: aldo/keto reductase [Candidatus Limiplasma sp.]|nr:aldo/keto reductase [Candidatus Limiplasma sp.]HRX09836.1 aldo/keto reductase [Candidatus Limiplasma sp.]
MMKKLGFGCMRLPHTGDKPDLEQFCRMTDLFLDEGFTYFDTSTVYGDSETMVRECLTSRHPRESYLLTNKLTESLFKTEADLPAAFRKQLDTCGVTYFDNYLLHAISFKNYQKFLDCNTFAFIRSLKAEGKVKTIGLSFHDKAALLDEILRDHPEIEVVQIQFNYVDYDNPSVEGKACYDVCRKYGKPVIIMEPVLGGALVNLPDEAKAVLDALHGGSYASYAIRFAASFEGVLTVLSGMSDLGQVQDNISYMKDFVPLSAAEYKAIDQVVDIFKKQNLIGCTACGYCLAGCPKHINIPAILSCLNNQKQHPGWNCAQYYGAHTQNSGTASDCIACGKCETVCPQHLPVMAHLKDAAAAFDQA